MRPSALAFSLPELLVVLAIAAVLATLAVPGFDAIREEWNLRIATQAVLGGLSQARLGALSRQGEGRLCPSGDGRACTARAAGFIVVAGDEGRAALLRSSVLPARVELSGNRPSATYYAWPRAASPVTLTLCALPRRARARHIVVSQTGRPRVERAADC
jgi:type IV fimbrial biogenesis protein FimT